MKCNLSNGGMICWNQNVSVHGSESMVVAEFIIWLFDRQSYICKVWSAVFDSCQEWTSGFLILGKVPVNLNKRKHIYMASMFVYALRKDLFIGSRSQSNAHLLPIVD